MKTFGIIGNPVKHSLSPPMHRAAYMELGLDADYSRFRVDEDKVRKAIDGAAALGVSGLNVTIPYKEQAANLDGFSYSEKAKKIGAVNTLDLENRKGYNTDSMGALRSLESRDIKVNNADILIIGAGGSARAIGFELIDAGANISIANRTLSNAENLCQDLGLKDRAYPLSSTSELINENEILINTTSVGMNEDKTPIPTTSVDSDHVVFDIVYTPRKTRLLREAEQRGAAIVEGIWMLVYQGAEAFEIWWDTEAPTDAMYNAVNKSLDQG